MVGIGEGTSIRPPETHYHSFGEPVFSWSSHESVTCAAAFTCSVCNSTRRVDCAVALEGGQFIATVDFEGRTYTDTMPMTVTFVNDAGGIADIGVHTIGSDEDLTLECTIPLEYFVSVEMDGVLVSAFNYSLASGSTLLTLSSNYLDTLSVGRHTVTMNYNIEGERQDVTTVIEIQRRATDNVPSTGDISNFTLWIVLMCVSVIGIIVICKSDKLIMIIRGVKHRK